jgi:two-component system chemotaxis response regulator CheY
MKTLIAEDDFTSRLLLQEFLKSHGECHIAVNGKEAVEAVRLALATNQPYELICLDIMMPEMDGQEALKEIRRMETAADVAWPNRVRIVMTTALADLPSVVNAIRGKCDCFLAKPVRKAKLLEELRKLALIN